MSTRFRIALLAYAGLLLASHLWIAATSQDGEPEALIAEDKQSLEVGTRDPAGVPGPPARLAFKTFGPPSREAVLLLHGSPGSLQDFDRLAAALGDDRYVLVPDMLGFGDSEPRVPDHSFKAQAAALTELLDHLGVERAHWVGFSWGGGVAIELSDRMPERTASLILVSALGVQELELLGHFTLNRLVHRLQHAFVIGLQWGVPHFGRFESSPLSAGFSRSFLDSDQRPLRAALEAFEGPMLVVHGRDDFLVPAAAATEHARLVPQSRLVWLPGGHLVLWSHAEDVARTLRSWLAEVGADRDGQLDRRRADPVRVLAATAPFERGLAGPQSGLGWLVFALLIFAASMVSEDLTCAGVGLLVAMGQVGLLGGILACVFALVAGDLVLYGSGRIFGAPLLARFTSDPNAASGFRDRLWQSGGRVVLFGRFVPGARLPTYLAAGALRFPVARFTFFLTIAALLWAPLLVGLTALGGRALEMGSASASTTLGAGIALILTIALAARLVPQLVRWKGRRLLASKWRRLRRWEFWPIWAIYAPLVPSILKEALRCGSLRAVTLVNPPIPGGGLAGESKTAIGLALAGAPQHAIPTLPLEPGAAADRFRITEDFMHTEGIPYPIVLKPDVGERGRGVEIIRNAEGLRAYLDVHPERALAQAFIPGQEFGLFSVRRPGAAAGELFSIARKTPRSVVGDGASTLERLILSDAICLPMAPKLLAQNEDRLGDVPAKGQRIQVAKIGTHSLGCRFLYGEDLRTDALEAAVDALSREGGLDFGRYDVLAEDEAALRRGAFKVVEFNGLTGEAAHCYDPRHGLLSGLAILREQWRIAFEIGAAHRAAGRKPLSYPDLWRLVRDSRA